MAGRYTRAKRVRLYGDKDQAALYIKRAEALLGTLMQRLRRTHQKRGHWEIEENGVYYVMHVGGAFPSVSITVTPAATAVDVPSTFALWIPRGFVVYPTSASSTSGWGAPVLQVGVSVFDVRNLVPGLDTDRWTSGGKLGEVFITQQLAGGYPIPQRELLPFFFTTDDVSVNKKISGAPLGANWHAYRMEFNDFTTYGGEGGAQRQTLFTEINHLHNYLLPVRGEYDPAARAVRYVRGSDFVGPPWLNDADLPAAPSGYVAAMDRIDHDGITGDIKHESITNAPGLTEIVANLRTEGHLADGTFVESATPLNLGGLNGAAAVSAAQRRQWIAYGNRYWIGDDTALPTLSWDGYPSWNWPSYLVIGVVQSDAWVDLDYFTANYHGADHQLFSKRLYANGRQIGTLPDFVLSAGVQTTGNVDRLVVLTCRLSDQPAYSPSTFTPYIGILRVYYADIPRRNGLALAPDRPLRGDAWTAAGTIDVFPAHFTNLEDYHGLLQPPQFKGDGASAVWVGAAYVDGLAFHNGAFALEGIFNSIASGTTDVVVSLVNLHERSEKPITPSGDDRYCLGVDYMPGSTNLQFFYAVNVAYGEGGGGIDVALRWSGSGVTSTNIAPTDVRAQSLFDGGFEFAAAWTLDPLRGAMYGIQQNFDFGSGHTVAWRIDYVVDGKERVVTTVLDTSTVTNWHGDVSAFNNWAQLALSSFAKDRQVYIAGFELAPDAALRKSIYDSSFADLSALTETPGSDVRFYPVGAV